MLRLSYACLLAVLCSMLLSTAGFVTLRIPRLPRSFRSLSIPGAESNEDSAIARTSPATSTNEHDADPIDRIHSSNVAGNLYVDESCIDCGACTWMNPNVFDKSVRAFVKVQPQTVEDKLSAYAAMIACPTGSIRTHKYDPLMEKVKDVFPAAIDSENIPGVFHAGFHTPDSFGETPYFIKRPGGNMLIGTPRFNERLAETIEQEGGLRYLILLCREANLYHKEWKKRFPALERIVHRVEVNSETASFEKKLDGLNRKWEIAPDLTIFHTPGYKVGSVCVLFTPNTTHTTAPPASATTTDTFKQDKPIPLDFIDGFVRHLTDQPWGTENSVLFTGLLNPTGQHSVVSKMAMLTADNPYGLGMHVRSLKALAHENVRFTWMLQAHGPPVRFNSLKEKHEAISMHADALDATRERGSDSYEEMLENL